MRYEDKKENQSEANRVDEIPVTRVSGMEQAAEEAVELTGDSIVDQFQAAVYTAGRRTLELLDSRQLAEALDRSDMEKAGDALKKLGMFRYNIGFAGPQSCGKSSLINAIIRYPLMPTCNLATTCTPVEVLYSKEIRVIVKDEDASGKIVFDKKCTAISEGDFARLKHYACSVMSIAIIENLQLFSDVYIAGHSQSLEDHLHLTREDPRQTAMLLLILLTVYVHQNNKELSAEEERLNALRLNTLSYFGIKSDVINYRVIIQWDAPMLASGLMITDLPGLGSSAEDKEVNGKLVKGHDTITKEAVLRTDTMAFMSEPQVLADAIPALETMVSNASLLDVVSVNDRIVPIMNKSDMLLGEQQKATTINMMLAMMKNAGVNMNNKKVWQISSLCGEYAYEGFDLAGSLYAQKEVFKLASKGYPDSKIASKIPDILEDLEFGYKGSGVDELREFFRTAFLGKGKYLTCFSAVAALKKLALDSIPGLQNKIDSVSVLAEVNEELAKTALGNLEGAAVNPINEAQKSTQASANKLVQDEEGSGIIDSLIRDAASQYIVAFEDAVTDYCGRLQGIINKFDLTWGGFGNRARVDSGNSHNHDLYEDLQDESRRLHVDMAKVNKVHAAALQHCKKGVEHIYQEARSELIAFQKDYPQVIKACVDAYRGKADPDVLALMDSLVPTLVGFVSAKVKTAETSIQQQTDLFQIATDKLAEELLKENDSFVQTLLEMVQGKLSTVSGGWFTPKEYLQIDGSDGLKAVIRQLPLTGDDKTILRDRVSTMALEQIKMPMLGWYTKAGKDVNALMGDLAFEMVSQFHQIRDILRQDTDAKNEKREKNVQTLDALRQIFAQLREDIQPHIDQALDLGIGTTNSSMKGDLFEGILDRKAGTYGQ